MESPRVVNLEVESLRVVNLEVVNLWVANPRRAEVASLKVVEENLKMEGNQKSQGE